MARWPRRGLLTQIGVAAVIAALLAVVVIRLLSAGPAAVDRTHALEERLRCPVCRAVSIADSPSATAASMRGIVAQQVAAGRSDEQVIAYFTGRYGAWILLDPPARGSTLLLWLLPPAAAGLGVILLLTRSRRPHDGPSELSEGDRRRVAAAVRNYPRSRIEDDEP